jgi:autotransporter-associated beta strand protein
MNPRSPREELKIRITTMLMGELPPDEAAALETQIAADAELTALHARLRRALGLLREATAIPEQPAPPMPARLSDERRARLLAHFQGAKPGPVIVKPRRDWKWAVPLGLAASLIALIGGAMYVNGFGLRKGSRNIEKMLARSDSDDGWRGYRAGMIRASGEKRSGEERQKEIFNHLHEVTSNNRGKIPGWGASFESKYAGATGGKDQILTEIFDYSRTANLKDDSRSHWSSQPGTVRSSGEKRRDDYHALGSVDELSYDALATPQSQPKDGGAGSTATASNAPRISAANRDRARFFVEGHSRSPELNLFGRPRVATWPSGSGPTETAATTPPPARVAGGGGGVYLPRAAAEVSASGFDTGMGNFVDLFAMPVVEPHTVSEPYSTDGKVDLPHALAPFSGPQSPQGGAVSADSGKPVLGGEASSFAGSFWDTPRVYTTFDRGVSGSGASFRGGLASSQPIANPEPAVRAQALSEESARAAGIAGDEKKAPSLYSMGPRLSYRGHAITGQYHPNQSAELSARADTLAVNTPKPAAESVPEPAKPAAPGVEISQANTKELSFDWMLGQSNIPGNPNVVTGGGTSQVPLEGIVLRPLQESGAGLPALAGGGQKADTRDLGGASSVVSRPPISSTAGLAKSGNGKLALSGNNSYAGGTTVTGGTVRTEPTGASGPAVKLETPPANPTPQAKLKLDARFAQRGIIIPTRVPEKSGFKDVSNPDGNKPATEENSSNYKMEGESRVALGVAQRVPGFGASFESRHNPPEESRELKAATPSQPTTTSLGLVLDHLADASNKPPARSEEAGKNPTAGRGEVSDKSEKGHPIFDPSLALSHNPDAKPHWSQKVEGSEVALNATGRARNDAPLAIDSAGSGRNDTNDKIDIQAGVPFTDTRPALGNQPASPSITLGAEENPGPIRIDYGIPVKDTAGPPPEGGKFQFNVGYKFGGESSEDARKAALDPQITASEGFINNGGPIAGKPPGAPAVAQPAVSGESGLRARWLEVARDGTLVNPAAKTTDGARRSDDNPVVGRIAFWTDDNTEKVNVNTAGGYLLPAGAAPAPKSALPGAGAEKSAAASNSEAARNAAEQRLKQLHYFADLNQPADLPQDGAGVTISSGVISGTAAVTLNKAGAGAWNFAGANTFTGGTTVNAGAVSVNPSNQQHPDGVHISGNTRTKDKVIRRDLAHAPGDLFDLVRSEAALNRGTLSADGSGVRDGNLPSVTTKSGQRSNNEVIRKFDYPVEFQTPEIPKNFGKAGDGPMSVDDGTVVRDNPRVGDEAPRKSAAVITGDIGFDVVGSYVTKGLAFPNDPHNPAGAGAARATAPGEVIQESARAHLDRSVNDGKDNAAKNAPESLNEMSVLEPLPTTKDVGASNSLSLANAAGKPASTDVEAKRSGAKRNLQDGAAPAAGRTDAPPPTQNNPEYAIKADGMPGYVKSPYDPQGRLVDVRGLPPGTEAEDPYTRRKFLVPQATERLEKKLAETSAAEAEKEEAKKKVEKLREEPPAPKPAPNPLVPQPEILTGVNAFSTFSLNVSDVAFKLAGASLEHGTMPDVSTLRSEEFINAFDYRDPEPAAGAPLGFVSERARYPFAQNRDLLRLSVKTAAAGRQPGRPLNIVLLIDNSGSMERADRVRILREGLRVLSAQLQPQDKLSIVTFARTPRLWADGVAGDKAGEVTARVGEITPEGGTNLSAALDLGYTTALRHYQAGSINHVVVLTDGAANLGDVDPAALKQKVEAHRKQGVALDCFGIGWEGLNDDMLEQLSRNGDGRYGFINTPEEAAVNFAGQLAGALRVAASDVKVQVEWNPRRVTAYRQVGYAKHQLTKEQFRDNTVDAAEIGAAESGNALYVVEVNPRGEGDLATVRVRFKVPGTSDYPEHEWTVPFTGNATPLEQSSSTLRLAATASAFSEMLASSPYATEVTSDRLLSLLTGVPAIYGADPRPKKLEWMIRQAKSLSGR